MLVDELSVLLEPDKRSQRLKVVAEDELVVPIGFRRPKCAHRLEWESHCIREDVLLPLLPGVHKLVLLAIRRKEQVLVVRRQHLPRLKKSQDSFTLLDVDLYLPPRSSPNPTFNGASRGHRCTQLW